MACREKNRNLPGFECQVSVTRRVVYCVLHKAKGMTNDLKLARYAMAPRRTTHSYVILAILVLLAILPILRRNACACHGYAALEIQGGWR
ncbi:hypothetical protein COCSADRAFT_330127 [Bipolaris sorokiniana ND90Pr]|uniref:Uncharacterized protein n=1 Tax=Cochliobolus sativus (strain ND90Pr / ATCC 201652) TaxID=665912 RepID=M2R9V3_COCSN|nr:uncharacterized protein COCSADRAFT_330127 [Bipolaris sorokiniana ND90Pr]EMD63649.1 hypothetical protein COCSADRAFT_330127 [Bipolaris sorokiniana ND90Pr]